MNERDWWKNIERGLKIVQACLTMIVAFWPVILKTPFSPSGNFFWLDRASKSSYSGVIVPVCLMLVAGIEVVKKLKGPSDKLEIVHSMLTDLQKEIFQGREPITNRVTLFRHKSWCFRFRRPWSAWPPWHGWLVPIERSGVFTRNSRCLFRASKNDPQPKGVAGQAFFNPELVVITPNLPNIEPTTDSNFSPPWYAYLLRLFVPLQYGAP